MDAVLFGILAIAAAESHYAGTAVVAVIGAFAACACLSRDGRRLWLAPLLGTALAGAVLLPWAPIAWRQMHVGLPWAPRSRNVGPWEMAAAKLPALLPASVELRGWLVPLGLASCAAVLLASWKSTRSRLREAAVPIVLPLLSAAGAFAAVGVAGPVARYVTVPAALVTIVFGGALAIVVASARDARGLERAFAVIGIGALVFWVGRQGAGKAGEMFARGRSGVSRSLIRDLCRRGLFRAGDLVIAAPDMLGPTLRYYLPPGVALRGFVHWEEPALADFGDYWSRWPDPREVASAVSKLERDLASENVRRVLLVYAVGNDNPLPFRKRTAELRSALTHRFGLVSSETYRGPSDLIQVDVFDALGVNAARTSGVIPLPPVGEVATAERGRVENRRINATSPRGEDGRRSRPGEGSSARSSRRG